MYGILLTTVAVYARIHLVGHVGVVRTSIGGRARLVMVLVGDSLLNLVDDVRHFE